MKNKVARRAKYPNGAFLLVCKDPSLSHFFFFKSRMQPHQRMTQAIKAKQETSAPILKCELATFHYFDVLLSYISLLLLLSLFLSGNNHSQIRQQAVLTYHCWPIRIPLPFAPDQNPFLNQLWLYNEKIEFLFLKGNTDKTVNSPHLVSLLSCS